MNLFESSNEDSKRQLVTIQKIESLEPIEGRDFIEMAKVLGYKCIVKKGEFSVGSLCVYHEVDSFVPVGEPEYSFLAKKAKLDDDGKSRARIQTMKLGQAYSQGLAMPLSVFGDKITSQKIGKAYAKELNVTKYEAGGSDRAARASPSFSKMFKKNIISLMPRALRPKIAKFLNYTAALTGK